MNKESLLRVALPVAAVVVSVGLGFAGISSAQSATSTSNGPVAGLMRMMHGGQPGVFGKVTAVSGNTLTVASTNPKDSTVTTYSVDATNAKVMKGSAGAAPVVSSVSAIAVGDTVAVRGTVTGTNVVATDVMDGIGGPRGFGGKGGPGMGMGAMGTVTAVNGTTVTITGKDGKTYTIDGSAATVSKTESITVGDIKVGDTIGARGTVSGTTITAKDIMDGVAAQGDGDGENPAQ
jgi:hypothetical protein